MTVLSDKTLAVRLETAEALNQVEYAKAYNRVGLEPEAAYKKIGSGYAVFAGINSPLSQSFGMGLEGEVMDDELDELEAFFRDRGAAVNVEICNMADMIMIQKLISRGYTISEFTHVLVRPISPADAFDVKGDYTIREAEEDEINTFSRVVAEGFVEVDSEFAQDALIEVFKVFFRQANCTCFAAINNGAPAGGGAAFIQDGVAELGGASTLPAHRNLGIQTGLLRRRLSFGASKGCDLAMVTTLPGTTSQRNVQRQGFQIAYARTKFTREWK